MLIVKSTQYGGRGTFATCDIPKSTLVLRDSPTISTLFDDFRKEVCVTCFAYQGGSNLKFPVGQSSRACSQECRLAFSGTNSKLQDFWDLVQTSKKKIDDVNYDLLRFCLSAYHSALYEPRKFREMLVLQDDYSMTTDLEKNSELGVVKALTLLFPDSPLAFPELVQQMLGRSKCNCFGIWEQDHGESFSESEMFGYALYVKSSFFNHSCSPNVTKLRIGREMQFTTTTNVLQGDELTISYLGDREYSNITERRRALESWGFDCLCSLCVMESKG